MRPMAEEDAPPAPGTARPPATLGEGCVRRYDPEALSDSDGTEFPGAAELWREVQTGGQGRQDEPAAD